MLLYIVDRALIAILPLCLHLLHKACIVSVYQLDGHLLDIKTLSVHFALPVALRYLQMAANAIEPRATVSCGWPYMPPNPLEIAVAWGHNHELVPTAHWDRNQRHAELPAQQAMNRTLFALCKHRISQSTSKLNRREINDTAQTPTKSIDMRGR